jgi:transposase-like protein
MSGATVYNWFRRARWPETECKPSGPHCGALMCYVLTRRRFRCSDCRKEFTVTSGTMFASRKLPFHQILAIIALLPTQPRVRRRWSSVGISGSSTGRSGPTS